MQYGDNKRWEKSVAWLATWFILFCFSGHAAEKVHTVRRGETLWGIARKAGISVATLADRNGLLRSQHIRIGQRLIVPAAGKPGAPSVPVLAPAIQRALDQTRVTSGRWRWIVIHHSGVSCGTPKGMDRYHREERRMQNGLAYHFVNGNGNGMGDGEISVGSRWTKQLDGGHLASESQNKTSLGICLVGNFDNNKPTPMQMRQLSSLVRALLLRCKLDVRAVKTHQQVNVLHTRCPGRLFPTQSWIASLIHKP